MVNRARLVPGQLTSYAARAPPVKPLLVSRLHAVLAPQARGRWAVDHTLSAAMAHRPHWRGRHRVPGRADRPARPDRSPAPAGRPRPLSGPILHRSCAPSRSARRPSAPSSVTYWCFVLPAAPPRRRLNAAPAAPHLPFSGWRQSLAVTARPPGRHRAATRPPSKIPQNDRAGSRRHPPQHLPFAERVPNLTPRLWTSDPGYGDPGSEDRRESGIPAMNGAAAAPTCNVHNLWINLLISMWGREVNGR
jgi:hypothetical protein